jgi:poly-gamma-glutamate synthesis protein (capsule biosynthesis protein)
MLGRGIDQILPHPVSPELYEGYVASASEYVALAEAANGPIARPASLSYVWGDAIAAIGRHAPDFRVVNLETAVTTSATPLPKGINYRMSPRNAETLTTFAIDCCSLANNHVLDWGRPGLSETIGTLRGMGIATAGAGSNEADAGKPAVLEGTPSHRLLVFGAALPTSGVPASWAATSRRPGVFWLKDLSEKSLERIHQWIAAERRPGDVVVLSLHWGGNWGYAVSDEEIAFARALVDVAGVDILHGHSSHHPRPLELHHGKPILYGCGDFINDYEGIRGYEQFRGDLVLGYVATLDPSRDNRLAALDLVPFRIRRFRLERAVREDADWLRNVLARESSRLGTGFTATRDGEFRLLLPGDVSDVDGIDHPP